MRTKWLLFNKLGGWGDPGGHEGKCEGIGVKVREQKGQHGGRRPSGEQQRRAASLKKVLWVEICQIIKNINQSSKDAASLNGVYLLI